MKLKVFHENEWCEYPAKTYAEYTYEWLGEPHESVSIKLDSSGNEVARNLNRFADTEPKQATLAEGSWYWQQFTYAKIEAGKTYTFSIIVDKISDDVVPIRVDLGVSATPNNYTRGVVSDAGNVVFGERTVITFTITEQHVEGGRDYLSFRIRNNQEATTLAYREAMLEESDTFDGYFDGDTPPDRAWTDFQPRNISGIKRIWPRSEAPPPAGTSYEWLGNLHDSMSVRLDSDGNETARNIFTHPRNFVITGSDRSAAVDLSTPGRIEVLASNYLNAYRWAINSGINYIGDPDFTEGEYERTYTMSVEVKAHVQHPEGFYNLRFDLRTPQIRYSEHGRIEDTEGEWVRVSTTLTLGADLQGDRSLFNFKDGANATPGDVIEYRDWKFERGSTATPYFDGSTASDRAHDLWYNADGVPHAWVNGTNGNPGGWVEV